MTRKWSAFIIAAGLALWFSGGIAFAQATPIPEIPGPELCQVPAPSFEAIGQIMATPVAVVASPVASPLPDASPVPVAESKAVAVVMRELIACFNAGEPLRAYGLYTDDYLRHLLSVQGVPNRTQYDGLAIAEPLHADRYVQILAIRDLNVLPNGGVRAAVTLRYAGIPVPKTFVFDLIESPAGWRIDDSLGEINFSLP
jgi:hypothetical protein